MQRRAGRDGELGLLAFEAGPTPRSRPNPARPADSAAARTFRTMRLAHLLEKLTANGLIGKALLELDHAHDQNMDAM